MSTIDEQIACIQREIGMRKRVYPRWVELHKMSQAKADREIEVMEDVLVVLQGLDEQLTTLHNGGEEK